MQMKLIGVQITSDDARLCSFVKEPYDTNSLVPGLGWQLVVTDQVLFPSLVVGNIFNVEVTISPA